jgi:hypothetical protein
MKKLILLIILLLAVVCLCACTPEEEPEFDWDFPIEEGFEYPKPTGYVPDSAGDHCAYSADTSMFDIDDVTLTFYFGGEFHTPIEFEDDFFCYLHYDKAQLIFKNDNGKEIQVGTTEEQYTSEKYRCNVTRNYEGTKKVFNHSEKLTIPKELFERAIGTITFIVSAPNVNPDVDYYYKLMYQSIKIRYFVNEETVYLISSEMIKDYDLYALFYNG